MFDVLSNGFKQAKQKLQGITVLDENNIAEAVATVRASLLEADVEYSVSKSFIKNIKERVVGEQVKLKAGKGEEKLKVSPGDHFIQICQQELEALMGPVDTDLVLPSNRVATIMMVGLQGAGKTTTSGKISKYLRDEKKRKPMLVAADIYRPAAIEQLKVLGKSIGIPVFHLPGKKPVEICHQAMQEAYAQNCDVVIFDTAGRLTIDTELMNELGQIKATTNPDNILLVVDSMMGQDSVTTAKAFDEKLSISGFVMTKLDGDARGGSALSIKEVTGKPIKFLGMGEDLDGLEVFRPDGLAGRILGQGDIVGLMSDFDKVAGKDTEEEAKRMLQGQFSFKDFYSQISMIQKMGPMKDILAKLPMQNMIPEGADLSGKQLNVVKSMIDSMTENERAKPALLNNSRMSRIAKGSGRTTKEVADLYEKFKGMRKMMGMMGKNMGMMGKIPGMGALKQMGQLRKMAKSMQGGGGMPDLSALMGGGGMPQQQAAAPKKQIDKDKLKKLRKAAKNARKKNRKR